MTSINDVHRRRCLLEQSSRVMFCSLFWTMARGRGFREVCDFSRVAGASSRADPIKAFSSSQHSHGCNLLPFGGNGHGLGELDKVSQNNPLMRWCLLPHLPKTDVCDRPCVASTFNVVALSAAVDPAIELLSSLLHQTCDISVETLLKAKQSSKYCGCGSWSRRGAETGGLLVSRLWDLEWKGGAETGGLLVLRQCGCSG